MYGMVIYSVVCFGITMILEIHDKINIEYYNYIVIMMGCSIAELSAPHALLNKLSYNE